MTSLDIDADFLSGPLTTASTFASYPRTPAPGKSEGRMPIPSVTLVDVVCCKPQTEGCMMERAPDTDGPFRTSQSDGCTDTVCNC